MARIAKKTVMFRLPPSLSILELCWLQHSTLQLPDSYGAVTLLHRSSSSAANSQTVQRIVFGAATAILLLGLRYILYPGLPER